MLGDPARLAGDHVGLADAVEQHGLAVVDVAHDGDDGRPRAQQGLVLLILVVVEVLGLELGFLLLAGVDQADGGAELGREQLHHVVAEGLGGGHHLALLEEKAHHVGRGPVELRTHLLGGRAPFDDDLAFGDGSVRGCVAGQLLGFELLEVASPAPGRPPLRRAATPTTEGRAASSTGGARAAAARSSGGPAEAAAATPAASGAAEPASGTCRPTGESGAAATCAGAASSRSGCARAGTGPAGTGAGSGRAGTRRPAAQPGGGGIGLPDADSGGLARAPGGGGMGLPEEDSSGAPGGGAPWLGPAGPPWELGGGRRVPGWAADAAGASGGRAAGGAAGLGRLGAASVGRCGGLSTGRARGGRRTARPDGRPGRRPVVGARRPARHQAGVRRARRTVQGPPRRRAGLGVGRRPRPAAGRSAGSSGWERRRGGAPVAPRFGARPPAARAAPRRERRAAGPPPRRRLGRRARRRGRGGLVGHQGGGGRLGQGRRRAPVRVPVPASGRPALRRPPLVGVGPGPPRAPRAGCRGAGPRGPPSGGRGRLGRPRCSRNGS